MNVPKVHPDNLNRNSDGGGGGGNWRSIQNKGSHHS